MEKVLKVICLLTITSVFANSSLKFGQRIQRENNTSLIDLVFRPTHGQQNRSNEAISKLNSIANMVPKNKKSNEIDKTLATIEQDEFKQENISETSEHKFVASKPKAINGEARTNTNASKQGKEKEYDITPNYDSFEMAFADVPELASSEQIRGAPIPPSPPELPPQFISNFQRFHTPENQEYNYENRGDRQSFYESAPKHSLDREFSENIPKGFPHPNDDRRVNYKKQRLGAQNYRGNPWGTKTSYKFRDPKNPNNFMEMSEVTMTINRQMDPQEAQSQIHRFLVAAQSGQYGPLSTIRANNN